MIAFTSQQQVVYCVCVGRLNACVGAEKRLMMLLLLVVVGSLLQGRVEAQQCDQGEMAHLVADCVCVGVVGCLLPHLVEHPPNHSSVPCEPKILDQHVTRMCVSEPIDRSRRQRRDTTTSTTITTSGSGSRRRLLLLLLPLLMLMLILSTEQPQTFLLPRLVFLLLFGLLGGCGCGCGCGWLWVQDGVMKPGYEGLEELLPPLEGVLDTRRRVGREQQPLVSVEVVRAQRAQHLQYDLLAVLVEAHTRQ
mmetsp:Transcript_40264/g.100777  ORF Transcript_40264/g.100777 Transcript_40264/m.100777 type:complete len:249 (-) Transcript_40264:1527-2273(-)